MAELRLGLIVLVHDFLLGIMIGSLISLLLPPFLFNHIALNLPLLKITLEVFGVAMFFDYLFVLVGWDEEKHLRETDRSEVE